MPFSNRLTLPISISLFIFFTCLNFNLQAQNQYWQHVFGATTLKVTNSGILIPKSNGVEVLVGNSNLEFSSFGKTLSNSPIPGGSVINDVFFRDQRDDLLFLGFNRAIPGRLEFHIYSADGTALDYEIPYVFNQETSSLFNRPVALKVNPTSYFIMDDTKAYHLRINSGNDYLVNYEIEHSGERMTDACLKNELIYVCDATGKVNLFDDQGEAGVWNIMDDAVFLNITPITGGFLITGEKAGKAILLEIDNNGEIIWQKEIGENRGWDVIQSNDGGILLTGENTDLTGFVMKMDANGEQLWRSDALDFSGVTLAESPYGTVYALGKDFDTNGTAELIKLGPNGEEGEDIGTFNSIPLQVNNIEANVSPLGELFFDGSDAQYKYPKGQNTATLFSAGLWLSGMDSGGNLSVSAATYLGNQDDFEMGPLDVDPSFFNRIWSISQAEIDLVKNDFSDGKQDTEWPLDILQWPAKGNTLINIDGEEYLIEEELAPFRDRAGDGIYDPYDGDYPLIKGEQMLWWIFNDDTPHFETGSIPLRVEVVGTLHATSGCSEMHPIYNTSFLEFEITNKSITEHSNFQAALWADPDLGCYTDDYIGSIPALNAFVLYNEDAIDGQTGASCPAGVNTYGDQVPIQSIVSMNNEVSSLMYYQNPSVGVHPPGTLDPGSALEYYNYMTSKWRDGTPLTLGGTGYDPASSAETTHAFPDDPSDLNGWSLCTANTSESDRRMIMSTAHATFLPGATIDLKFALITTPESDLPCPDMDLVKADIEEIQAIHDLGGTSYNLDLGPDLPWQANSQYTLDAGAGAASYLWSNGATEQTIIVDEPGTYSVTIVNHFGCEQIDEIEILVLDGVRDPAVVNPFKVFPNPSAGQFTIALNEPGSISALHIFSATGALVRSAQPQLSENTFSVEGLAPGLYLINVRVDGEVFVERLVVL